MLLKDILAIFITLIFANYLWYKVAGYWFWQFDRMRRAMYNNYIKGKLKDRITELEIDRHITK